MSDNDRNPTHVLTELMPAIRKRRELNAQGLAEEIKRLGGKLDRAAISKIENGLRGVSLDEAFLLAVALDVSPTHLFVPRDDDDAVSLAPEVTTTALRARRWMRGQEALPGRDDRAFHTEVPESEWAQRRTRIVEAEEAVERASRRHRVAREKLNLLMAERGKLDVTPATSLGLRALGQNVDAEEARLDARVDAALDQVAEAKVDLEDARARLRRIQAEEGEHGDR